jgi:hypothetical protein
MSDQKSESSPKTDVILVVKGAGLHEPDDTLNLFLKGFWSAVQSIDKDATIRQVHDAFDDYKPTPHAEKPHKHLTEINTKDGEGEERRIWVKEVYWETELTPPSPWLALFNEWHMATYALRRELSNYFRGFSRTAKPLGKFYDAFLVYWAHFLIYFLFGAFFMLAFVTYFPDLQFERIPFRLRYLVILSTLIMAWPQTLRISWRTKGPLERLPGLQRWIVLLLVVTFLLNTQVYLQFFLYFFIPVFVINIVRNWLWRFRPCASSDRQLKEITLPNGDVIKIRTDLLPDTLFYRLIVVLGLPIAFFLYFVAWLLKVTWILGDVGKKIEEMLSSVLGSILGDVSAYAMDPTQAHRIRSVVETDIKFFDNDQIDRIHVFAHSQGTPITFETLFRQLEDEHRKKIKTYVTIGSVLGYYYQVTPILDRVYGTNRFRLEWYPEFAEGFRWFNCWNLIDPIAQFCGLDQYEKKGESAGLGEGDPVIPINIKTRFRGHSDYWTNLKEVQIPFANHVLGIQDSPHKWPSQPSDFFPRNQNEPAEPKSFLTRIVTWWKRWWYTLLMIVVFLSTLYLDSLIVSKLLGLTKSYFSLIDLAGTLVNPFISTLEEIPVINKLITELFASGTFMRLGQAWNWALENLDNIFISVLSVYLFRQLYRVVSYSTANFLKKKSSF